MSTIGSITRLFSKFQILLHEMLKISSLPDGKPIGRQIHEILRLKYGPTKLSASNYYDYNLGNKRIYHDVDLTTFGGEYMKSHLAKLLNSPEWEVIAKDKFITSVIFSSMGVPQPELYAVACRFARDFGSVKTFSTEEEVSNYLKQDIPYPFFCKPVRGSTGSGCQRVEAYDSKLSQLRLADGSDISISAFLHSLVDHTGWGFLFQEALLPHPDTAEICGDSVSGCRFCILLDDETAHPFSVTWKLPAKGNYIDNFAEGTLGTLLADVDVETGRVTRVVSGFGSDLKVCSKHCDTEIEIVGMKVPDWERMKEILVKTAKGFPGIRFQHWDVGLTSKGPVIYELNSTGGLAVLELARGRGVYDTTLKLFINDYCTEGSRRLKSVGLPFTTL